MNLIIDTPAAESLRVMPVDHRSHIVPISSLSPQGTWRDVFMSIWVYGSTLAKAGFYRWKSLPLPRDDHDAAAVLLHKEMVKLAGREQKFKRQAPAHRKYAHMCDNLTGIRRQAACATG